EMVPLLLAANEQYGHGGRAQDILGRAAEQLAKRP
ncbi:MAG: hypothetical protein AVDCRST_MAG93-5934, partial [uncultured Chloroflexia bacterium]